MLVSFHPLPPKIYAFYCSCEYHDACREKSSALMALTPLCLVVLLRFLCFAECKHWIVIKSSDFGDSVMTINFET